MTANFELPTPELLKVLADNWATNTLKAFPGIATPEQFRSAVGIKEPAGGVVDPGHGHGTNWIPQTYNHTFNDPGHSCEGIGLIGRVSSVSNTPAPVIPEAIILSYIAGTRMDATQEARTYWHQWYHHLSLSEKYHVDAFRLKYYSDMVKNQPQHVGEIIGAKVVAHRAECINDQLKWTPVMAEDTDKPKTPETKEQYEERRNKRIADRVAADMLADANKKLKAKEDAPERHWSDHRPWYGAHGSQYMLRF